MGPNNRECQFDRLFGHSWLAGWLGGWLVDSWVACWLGWLVGVLVVWLVDCQMDCLLAGLVGWLVGWLGWLVGWFVGWLCVQARGRVTTARNITVPNPPVAGTLTMSRQGCDDSHDHLPVSIVPCKPTSRHKHSNLQKETVLRVSLWSGTGATHS